MVGLDKLHETPPKNHDLAEAATPWKGVQSKVVDGRISSKKNYGDSGFSSSEPDFIKAVSTSSERDPRTTMIRDHDSRPSFYYGTCKLESGRPRHSVYTNDTMKILVVFRIQRNGRSLVPGSQVKQAILKVDTAELPNDLCEQRLQNVTDELDTSM